MGIITAKGILGDKKIVFPSICLSSFSTSRCNLIYYCSFQQISDEIIKQAMIKNNIFSSLTCSTSLFFTRSPCSEQSLSPSPRPQSSFLITSTLAHLLQAYCFALLPFTILNKSKYTFSNSSKNKADVGTVFG